MNALDGDVGPPLDITVVTGRSSIVVSVTGEVDLATAGQVLAALNAVVDGRPAVPVTADLAGVSLLDAAGMTALVQAWDHARERDVSLRVVNPQPLVRRVLDIVGLTRILQIPPHRPS